jgi:anti-sigma regulatory factor (Ser/Thr protein kinase)
MTLSDAQAETVEPHDCHGRYRHQAFFYASPDEFMAGTLPFIRGGVSADEPTLVVLDSAKITALRGALGADASRVVFADMLEVGANPARIIPIWQDFVEEHSGGGRRVRGIGEPIWAGRSLAELAECKRHEELLNIAFDDPAFDLLCPYDSVALDPAVLHEARRTHPVVREDGKTTPSVSYPGVAALSAPFDEPLPDPVGAPAVRVFRAGDLREPRAWVKAHAASAGLSSERTADLVLAVNEITTNSLMYGGGHGVVSMWQEHNAVICEVRDAGRITNPLADRTRPTKDVAGGRGLWLANKLCELVQIRAVPAGTVVRLHMHAPSQL